MTSQHKIFIQIKNAEKVFRHKTFKLMGHDFPRFIEQIKNKVSVKEGLELIQLNEKLHFEAGDYEVYIRVHPNKIEIVKFYEVETPSRSMFQ